MKLRARMPLDLHQRRFLREAAPVGTVGPHRVETVRHDQEVRRERQVVAADTVVAGAVRPFVMELHRPGLGCDELEPLEQARREARMAPHRGPLRTVEAAALA